MSAGGWAVGYVGGGLLLLINAVMISKPHLFGFADAGQASQGVAPPAQCHGQPSHFGQAASHQRCRRVRAESDAGSHA